MFRCFSNLLSYVKNTDNLIELFPLFLMQPHHTHQTHGGRVWAHSVGEELFLDQPFHSLRAVGQRQHGSTQRLLDATGQCSAGGGRGKPAVHDQHDGACGGRGCCQTDCPSDQQEWHHRLLVLFHRAGRQRFPRWGRAPAPVPMARAG